MLRLTQPQLSLADAWLAPELRQLPKELAIVDQWLDDERFMGPYRARFNIRSGRPTLPVERYQRLMYLKSRYRLGYESLVSEVSDSIHWRLFCRIPLNEKVPHSTTLSKLTRKYGPEIVEELNGLLVGKMAEEKLIRGAKAQMDTTAVESNIEHPTDANLLEDGIRFIDRCVKKLGQAVEGAAEGFRSGVRKAKKILFDIGATLKTRATKANEERDAASSTEVVPSAAAAAAESRADASQAGQGRAGVAVAGAVSKAVEVALNAVGEAGGVAISVTSKATKAAKSVGKKLTAKQEKIEALTAQMADVAQQTARQGRKILERVRQSSQALTKDASKRLEAMFRRLEDALDVTGQLLGQTALRLRGVRSIPNRLVSILDREARAICRGKLGRSIEFGYKVLITEVEAGIVAAYKVLRGNPADATLALPGLDQIKQLFGRVPRGLATDQGFSSEENERKLKRRGVKRISIHRKGRRTKRRQKVEASSWFRRLQRWRAGGEATIGRLKRSYGLERSYLLGYDGTATWVGFSVFTANLHRLKRLVPSTEAGRGGSTAKIAKSAEAADALPAAC